MAKVFDEAAGCWSRFEERTGVALANVVELARKIAESSSFTREDRLEKVRVSFFRREIASHAPCTDFGGSWLRLNVMSSRSFAWTWRGVRAGMRTA